MILDYAHRILTCRTPLPELFVHWNPQPLILTCAIEMRGGKRCCPWPTMTQPDENATSASDSQHIGLLLSGDLKHPILDADTVLARRWQNRCRRPQQDTIMRKARPSSSMPKGTTLAPGLIDSHVHPWPATGPPRQNQIGWIDSYLHGGVTTMISAGEVHNSRPPQGRRRPESHGDLCRSAPFPPFAPAA